MPEIVLIAAIARNHVIGRDNQLLWNVPEDMAHFKALTQGHAVLMGRKTWESLPARFRPLPGRRNIVVSRQIDYAAPGAELAPSLDAALALMAGQKTVFVIGGADIYRQALTLADRLELTELDLEPEGDAWFPVWDHSQWRESARQTQRSKTGLGYAFVTWKRV
ncbi:MAG: dihydrofolate reductase [Azonexus sp.]|jgi:dihydrofolate reductase|uniref:dihydrofolate reductase n=1 Tax=Azonexus sp. TaxID=1872668 RepID=UPI00282F6FF3|nr:dihydrofolate reductase [Azonexus sp.]MDR0776084.1 dihydrofolate reductase [Azonexus sp.]